MVEAKAAAGRREEAGGSRRSRRVIYRATAIIDQAVAVIVEGSNGFRFLW